MSGDAFSVGKNVIAQRVLIKSRKDKNEDIPGFVLVPGASGQCNNRRRMRPGVRRAGLIAIHQHGGRYDLGKSEPAGLAGDPSMHYGLELAQRGCVVVAIDLPGFEDRQPDPAAHAALGTSFGGRDHEVFEAMYLLAAGSCLQAKYLSDLMDAVSYVASRNDVDPARLGVYGHSMGGQEAAMLMSVDDRIAAGVASCGLSSLECLRRHSIISSLSTYVPGLMSLGDMGSIVAGLAPRPFMMICGRDDKRFPFEGASAVSEAARTAYEAMGASESFACIVHPGGHELPERARRASYDWLMQKLERPILL